MKKYYVALIEVDQTKFDTTTGTKFVSAVKDIIETAKPAGECLVYEVTDAPGFLRVRNELKRCNKI